MRITGTSILQAIVLLLCGILVTANAAAARQLPNSKEVNGRVLQIMQSILYDIRHTRTILDTENAKDIYYDILNKNIAPIIDLPLITKRIMGKYWQDANQVQRKKLADIYHNNILITYAEYLAKADPATIGKTIEYRIVRSPQKSNIFRIAVPVLLKLGDTVYEVIYAMYYNRSSNRWLLENILINDINHGALYREKFITLMKVHEGNYDRVLSYWGGRIHSQ